MYKHIFYHADRAATLKEGQELLLDENGLSYFGKVYWPAIQDKQFDEMNDAEQREFCLHQIHSRPEYSLYTSRLQSIFAASSIAEAIVFANSIEPKPNHPIPIIEIFSDRFWTLDTVWLDYVIRTDGLDHFVNYWKGKISNHHPKVGERMPPRLEVMIALPATAGKIVYIVQ
jgi:hypothetical protein